MALNGRQRWQHGKFLFNGIAGNLGIAHPLEFWIFNAGRVTVGSIIGRQIQNMRTHRQQRVAAHSAPIDGMELRLDCRCKKQQYSEYQLPYLHMDSYLTWKSSTLSSPIYPLRCVPIVAGPAPAGVPVNMRSPVFNVQKRLT